MTSETTSSVHDPGVTLPPSAPLVRITAGTGSAGQKTWNLRRPVTLIGSRRPAHIVLHDAKISKAHCVIVNTGTDVLLKDLNTSGTTCVNSDPVDLTVLSDGDVITVGATSIQVAIRTNQALNDDSGFDVEFDDPTKLRKPVRLGLIHTDKDWLLRDAVTMIGRHSEAAVHLDHADVSGRHAIVFRFGRSSAVFDLGSRTGVSLNGQCCSLALVGDGDRLTIGRFGLFVGKPPEPDAVGASPDGESTSVAAAQPGAAGHKPTPASLPPAPISPFTVASAGFARARSESSAGGSAPASAAVAGVRDNVAETWDKLDTWELGLQSSADDLANADVDLSAKVAELEAQEAALRGRLHDVSQLTERIAQREGELAAEAARVQEASDRAAEERKQIDVAQADLRRRDEELHRRENALAQRWTRLRTTKCRKCGEPLKLGELGSTDSP